MIKRVIAGSAVVLLLASVSCALACGEGPECGATRGPNPSEARWCNECVSTDFLAVAKIFFVPPPSQPDLVLITYLPFESVVLENQLPFYTSSFADPVLRC
jgi:hypothetical protein